MAACNYKPGCARPAVGTNRTGNIMVCAPCLRTLTLNVTGFARTETEKAKVPERLPVWEDETWTNKIITQKLYAEYIRLGGTWFDTRAFVEGGPLNRFVIKQTDWVLPVCHQGQCRSQAMYIALTRAMEAPKGPHLDYLDWVGNPHGATSGGDPFQKLPPGGRLLSEGDYWNYTYDSFPGWEKDYDANKDQNPEDGPKARGYALAFERNRVARAGDQRRPTGLNVNPDDVDFKSVTETRKGERKWFDDNYFKIGPANQGPEGFERRVFFAYARAPSVLMQRLVEQGKAGCGRTVIVAIDGADTITNVLQNSGHLKGSILDDRMKQVWEEAVHHCREYFVMEAN